jgi:hypothetical protein
VFDRCREIPILVLLMAFAVPGPSGAADSTFRTLQPFHRSEQSCLSLEYDGSGTYWLNHCSHPVTVRADDPGKCVKWGCLEEVPANARVSTAVSRHPRWCECAGTLATCNLPANGC